MLHEVVPQRGQNLFILSTTDFTDIELPAVLKAGRVLAINQRICVILIKVKGKGNGIFS